MKYYVSEFIGTFAIVFFGTGAVIVNIQTGGVITHTGISMTFGLVVMSMIYGLGSISGAHMNPAVSVAFAFSGRFQVKQLLPYIVSQIAGGVFASWVLKMLFPASELLGATLPAGSEMQSFVLEFIFTFFLMLVVISVATGSKEQGLFAGIAIGSVVALEALFGGPISGASMNPARSLGPAIVSGHLEHLWIYLAGPTAGAVAAVLLWNLFLCPEDRKA